MEFQKSDEQVVLHTLRPILRGRMFGGVRYSTSSAMEVFVSESLNINYHTEDKTPKHQFAQLTYVTVCSVVNPMQPELLQNAWVSVFVTTKSDTAPPSFRKN